MFGEQEVACRLAVLRIADEDRCDVGLARHDREAGRRKHCQVKRGCVRSCHFRGKVCGEANLPARCSHGIKTCWRTA
jgi:hypothetical protein